MRQAEVGVDHVLVTAYLFRPAVGKQLADGRPEEVRGNQDVIDAYLGVPHEEDVA